MQGSALTGTPVSCSFSQDLGALDKRARKIPRGKRNRQPATKHYLLDSISLNLQRLGLHKTHTRTSQPNSGMGRGQGPEVPLPFDEWLPTIYIPSRGYICFGHVDTRSHPCSSRWSYTRRCTGIT